MVSLTLNKFDQNKGNVFLFIIIALSSVLFLQSTITITDILSQSDGGNNTSEVPYETSDKVSSNTSDILYSTIGIALAIISTIYTKFIANSKNKDQFAWVQTMITLLNSLKDNKQTVYETNKMLWRILDDVDPSIAEKLKGFPMTKLEVLRQKAMSIEEKVNAITGLLKGFAMEKGNKLSSKDLLEIQEIAKQIAEEENKINAENK